MSLTSILEDALEDARKESEQQGKLRPPYAALCKINSELKQQLHAAERRARRWEAFARKTWAKKLTPAMRTFIHELKQASPAAG